MTKPSSQTPAPDDLAQRYIRLAHALDAHSPGYIDGYGGPAGLADRTLRPAADLLSEAGALHRDVQAEPDPSRRAFLVAQTRAMHTLARMLGGEKLPYAEEVRGLYDIEPERADLSELDAGPQGTRRRLARQGQPGGARGSGALTGDRRAGRAAAGGRTDPE